MCLATPAQVVEVAANAVLVRHGREASARVAEVRLPPGMAVVKGDWVLVYASLAIGVIPEGEVEPLLELGGEIWAGNR